MIVLSVQVILVGFLLGIAVPIILYFVYKRHIRGRVIVDIVYPDRSRKRFAVLKKDDGHLRIDGKDYVFDENYITYGRAFLVREATPYLSYVEGLALPQNPFERGPSPEGSGISSDVLSTFMDNHDMREFSKEFNSNITNTQLLQSLGVGLVALGVLLIGVTWYITQQLGGPA